jgi:hypothetical protein
MQVLVGWSSPDHQDLVPSAGEGGSPDPGCAGCWGRPDARSGRQRLSSRAQNFRALRALHPQELLSNALIKLGSGQIPLEDLWTTMKGLGSAATPRCCRRRKAPSRPFLINWVCAPWVASSASASSGETHTREPTIYPRRLQLC